MVVVEGQSTDFAVVWVSVLLGNVLEGTMGDVGVGGHYLLTLTLFCLTHHVLRHLPQAHGAISGSWEHKQDKSTLFIYLPSARKMCSASTVFFHTPYMIQATDLKLPYCH